MIKSILILLMVGLLYSEEYGNQILIPLNGEKIYLSVKAKGGMSITKQTGPDFNVFYLYADDKDMPWSLSVYDGSHPKDYSDEKVGKFKFMIGKREETGLIYKNKDNIVFGVVRHKYNTNDVVQLYIVFVDEKSIEGKLASIPQVDIIQN